MELRELVAKKGLLYGAAVSVATINSDPEFVELALRHAGIFVAENNMKWQTVNSGKPENNNYGRADTVAAFALENSLVLRGHNLLWYRGTPHWFFDLPCKKAMERAIVEHIHSLVARYRGRVHSWDVVNEAIEPENGRPDGLRTAVFLDKMGPDYFDLAHRTAREADPEAPLVVNEFSLELDGPVHEARRIALLNLLELMRRSGTPVDVVGVQAHLLCAGAAPFSASRLRRFLAEIASLGLTIRITKLYVIDTDTPADQTVRDRLVADTHGRFLDAALDEPAVKMVVTRGLSDRYSWLAKSRRDQLPSRSLPFDADLAPKPTFETMAGPLRMPPNAGLIKPRAGCESRDDIWRTADLMRKLYGDKSRPSRLTIQSYCRQSGAGCPGWRS
jgi:endo-1,4-beta-xylanase